MVEFVSYNGHGHCWCYGELILRIDGEEVNFGKSSLTSGGSCCCNGAGEVYVDRGPWKVDVPPQYAQYAEEITAVVNRNIPWGCCGGCI